VSLKIKYWLLATVVAVFAIVFSVETIDLIYKRSLEKDISNIMLQETRNFSLVYSKMLDNQLDPDSLEIITRFSPESNYGYYYVIDSSGKVLFHSDKTKIDLNLKEIGLDNLLKEIINKESGIHEYTYNSNKILAVFSKLKNKNLYVIHAVNKSDILKVTTKAKRLFLILLISISVSLALLIYLFMGYFLKPLVNQTNSVKEFSVNISTSVMENSSAAVEVKNVTENTKESYDKLDSLIQDFATSIEEARAEIENIFGSLKNFINDTTTMANKSVQIAGFTDSLNELNERITEISDTISVLAINATIESSKENIDREGLNRISELITDVSASARKMAKESRKLLNEIRNNISESVLISEKISKDTKVTEESLETIRSIMDSFVDNINEMTKLSHNFRYSMEEVLSGVEQLMDSINDISSNIEKLVEEMKKLKI